jgi:hypothetical protein
MCLLTPEAVALTPIGENMLELISSFDPTARKFHFVEKHVGN